MEFGFGVASLFDDVREFHSTTASHEPSRETPLESQGEGLSAADAVADRARSSVHAASKSLCLW